MTDKIKFEELLGSRARTKILRVLAQNDELTISLIIRKTKLNYASAVKHLDYLKKVDFIQEKKYGRIRIYRYKTENRIANSLKKFISLLDSREE